MGVLHHCVEALAPAMARLESHVLLQQYVPVLHFNREKLKRYERNPS